jgi:hypothetical protein
MIPSDNINEKILSVIKFVKDLSKYEYTEGQSSEIILETLAGNATILLQELEETIDNETITKTVRR